MLKVFEYNKALMDLHWLPTEQQIQYLMLTFTYKGINNIAPKYIMDLIGISKPRRDNLQSNNARIRLNVQPENIKPLLQDHSAMWLAHYGMHSQRTSD